MASYQNLMETDGIQAMTATSIGQDEEVDLQMPTMIRNRIAVKLTNLKSNNGPNFIGGQMQGQHIDERNYQPKVNQGSIINAICNDNKMIKLEEIHKRKLQKTREYQMLQEEKMGIIGSLNSKGRDFGTQMNFSE